MRPSVPASAGVRGDLDRKLQSVLLLLLLKSQFRHRGDFVSRSDGR